MFVTIKTWDELKEVDGVVVCSEDGSKRSGALFWQGQCYFPLKLEEALPKDRTIPISLVEEDGDIPVVGLWEAGGFYIWPWMVEDFDQETWVVKSDEEE